MNHRIFGISLAVVLVFALTLMTSGCSVLNEVQMPPAPEPLIYSTDGQVFMACGENTVCLAGAQVVEDSKDKTIRAEISKDNRTLIYISDYDESTGAGTLMGVRTDCLSQPYSIDTGVYAAEISADGNRALLVKNVADDVGDLYLYKGEGAPQLLCGGVSRENLGFSPDGKTICYEKERRLYVQEDGREAMEAADTTKAGSLYVMNGGRLLYGTSYYIYFFANGETQVEAEDAYLVKVQKETDTYLYRTPKGFFSKQPGREAKLLIEDARGIEIWTEFQYSGSLYNSFFDNAYVFPFKGDRFLMAKRDYADNLVSSFI